MGARDEHHPAPPFSRLPKATHARTKGTTQSAMSDSHETSDKIVRGATQPWWTMLRWNQPIGPDQRWVCSRCGAYARAGAAKITLDDVNCMIAAVVCHARPLTNGAWLTLGADVPDGLELTTADPEALGD